MNNVENKQRELSELQRRVNMLQSEITNIQGLCRHNWSKAIYQPIYTEGYTIPGDPPGTMGIDWRGPCYVPSSTKKVWMRKCKECNLEQKTERTRFVTGNSTIDGCDSKQEVPDFGDL